VAAVQMVRVGLQAVPIMRATTIARAGAVHGFARRVPSECAGTRSAPAGGANMLHSPTSTKARPPLPIPRPGHLVARRYVLESRVGSGGMASVWRAFDRALEVVCAVKILNPEATNGADVRARFRREAHVCACIRCANVVDVFDYGEWLGLPYIAMEYLRGEDLRARIERGGALAPDMTYQLLVQLGRGLARAHGAGIIHRDVKPENVFLVPGRRGETAKLLDFGIARQVSPRPAMLQTQGGLFLGTAHYSSPEQMRGEPVDWRSDLWSLSVVAFECMTAEVPFRGRSLAELCTAILCTELPTLDARARGLPLGLESWWRRAIDRDPVRRYQSVKQLVDAFGEALAVKRAHVPSLPPRAPEVLPPTNAAVLAADPARDELAGDRTVRASDAHGVGDSGGAGVVASIPVRRPMAALRKSAWFLRSPSGRRWIIAAGLVASAVAVPFIRQPPLAARDAAFACAHGKQPSSTRDTSLLPPNAHAGPEVLVGDSLLTSAQRAPSIEPSVSCTPEVVPAAAPRKLQKSLPRNP
jgi:eukaryotic-like serine/threonine-protein kinase